MEQWVDLYRRFGGKRKVTAKKTVDIDAEHVEITSAETTDKVAADKVLAAQTAAEKVRADAEIAAEVKRQDAAIAREVRATEVRDAAAKARLEWWKTIMLPVMLALIAGSVTAIPGSITAWNQSIELREIKRTGKEDQQTGKETHSLVNSRMTAQLKISAAALRAVARITMNVDDEAAADMAEKMLADQENAQKEVDRNKGGKP